MNEILKEVIIGVVAGICIFFGFVLLLHIRAYAAEIPDDQNPYRGIITNATAEELREMEGCLYIECRGESWEGQIATAQVMLNRVLSDDYPNTIHGVLSQVDSGYRQYASYPKCLKVTPGEQQSDLIEWLCDGGEWVLSTDYVYQSRKQQGKNRVKIDHHWFGTR